MTNEQIEKLCKVKEQELLNKHFASIGTCAETVEEKDKMLPLEIEAEYFEFLKELWGEIAPNDPRSINDILDEKKLRKLMTDDNREEVDIAFEDAKKRTIWERLFTTNYKDVDVFRSTLADYAKDLLLVMRCDFLEEVTGNHIKNKTFEDD